MLGIQNHNPSKVKCEILNLFSIASLKNLVLVYDLDVEVSSESPDDYEGEIAEIIEFSTKNVYASFYEIPENLEEFYSTEVMKSKQQILNICVQTIQQSKVRLWHEVRQTRISSSIAHRIKTRSQGFLDLALSILNNTFTGNSSTEYGLKMESIARKKYAELTKTVVAQLGVVISQCCPWLCASPDGVARNNGSLKLLEVKCPSSCAGKEIVNRDSNVCNVPYLEFVDGNLTLNQNHSYFTQIQVSLFVLNLEECDFLFTAQRTQCY